MCKVAIFQSLAWTSSPVTEGDTTWEDTTQRSSHRKALTNTLSIIVGMMPRVTPPSIENLTWKCFCTTCRDFSRFIVTPVIFLQQKRHCTLDNSIQSPIDMVLSPCVIIYAHFAPIHDSDNKTQRNRTLQVNTDLPSPEVAFCKFSHQISAASKFIPLYQAKCNFCQQCAISDWLQFSTGNDPVLHSSRDFAIHVVYLCLA